MVKAAPVLAVSNDVEERLREQEERRRTGAGEARGGACCGKSASMCGFGPLDYKIVSATSYSSGRSTENLQSWSRNRTGLAPERGDRILIQLPEDLSLHT